MPGSTVFRYWWVTRRSMSATSRAARSELRASCLEPTRSRGKRAASAPRESTRHPALLPAYQTCPVRVRTQQTGARDRFIIEPLYFVLGEAIALANTAQTSGL